jgi:hypothetical protein
MRVGVFEDGRAKAAATHMIFQGKQHGLAVEFSLQHLGI